MKKEKFQRDVQMWKVVSYDSETNFLLELFFTHISRARAMYHELKRRVPGDTTIKRV